MTYILNIWGPITEPWITPKVTSVLADWASKCETYCVLPLKKSPIHLRKLPQMPNALSFSIRAWWGTLSKAWMKSMVMMSHALSLLRNSAITASHWSRFVTVERCRENLCCSWQSNRYQPGNKTFDQQPASPESCWPPYVYMYICIYVYMYTCIHVYMYTCIYVYYFCCMLKT